MFASFLASFLLLCMYGLVKSLWDGITFQNPYMFVDDDQKAYLWQKEYLASWQSFLRKGVFHDMLGFHFLSADQFQNQDHFRNMPHFITAIRLLFVIILCGILVFIFAGPSIQQHFLGNFYFVPAIILLIFGSKIALTAIYQGFEGWRLVWKTITREIKDAFENKRTVQIRAAFRNTEWRKSVIKEIVQEETQGILNSLKRPIFALIKTFASWKESVSSIAFYFIYMLCASLTINSNMRSVISSIDYADDDVEEMTKTPLKRITFLTEKLGRIAGMSLFLIISSVIALWFLYHAFYYIRYKVVSYFLENLYVLPLSQQVFAQFFVRTLYGFYPHATDTVDLELFKTNWRTAVDKQLLKGILPWILVTFVCAYLMMLSVMVWIESDPYAYYHYNGQFSATLTNTQLRLSIKTYTQVTKAMLFMTSILFGAFLILKDFTLDKTFYISAIFLIIFLALFFLTILFLFI